MKLSMKQNIGIIIGAFVFFSGIIQGVTPYTGEDQWGNILRDADQKNDQIVAIKLYEQVAGDIKAVPCARAYAKLQLGTRYFHGSHGLTQNDERARELYEDAKDILDKTPQKDTACLKNQAKVWLELGQIYCCGRGTSQNLGKARELFEKAAKQTHNLDAQAVANLELAHDYYCYNCDVKKDLGKARELFEKVASQKANPSAQARALYSLAELYSETKYKPDEIRRAFENAAAAAADSNDTFSQAEAWLGLGHFYWDGKLVPRDLGRAQEYFEKVTNQAVASVVQVQAWVALGEMYYERGDFSKALEFFNKVNEQQAFYVKAVTLARAFLGKMYSNGHGVAQDVQKALELLNQATQIKDNYTADPRARALARFQLAEIYAKGLGGVEKDLDKARKLYEQAQGQDVDLPLKAQAALILGEMHMRGQGVPKIDLTRAEGLLKDAQERIKLLLKRVADGVAKEQMNKVLTQAGKLLKELGTLKGSTKPVDKGEAISLESVSLFDEQK